MSELQPIAEGSGGVGNAMPPRTLDAEEGDGRSYWGVVGRAYWRSSLNRIATICVLGIILLTIMVPFVANQAPYTAVIDGKREFPLLRDLTRIDWIWLTWGIMGAIYLMVYWRLGRQNPAPETRGTKRWQWLGIVCIAAVAVSLMVTMFKNDYLDPRNYHEMARIGNLQQAVFPPLRWGFADQEPLEASRIYSSPSSDHWLGTDEVGRDVLARLLWGARIVLEVGLVSEILAVFIGAIYGALMGYFVGKTDILGMRFVEIVEAIPLLFLLITFVAIFGRQLFMIMVLIGVTGWTPVARFVRAEFLRIRQLDYVAAAKALGLPLRNILFKHMLPNGLTPVIVTFTFGVAGNIVSESILSFLGIGVEPPTASWGAMLNEAGNPAETFRWWLAIAPGLLIFLTVFAYNIIGEGLRDAIDPRLNKVQ